MVTDSAFRWADLPVIMACVVLLAACGGDSTPLTDEQAAPRSLRVFAVNAPLAWMAGEIGGDRLAVQLPVPEGIDPADWKPNAEQVLAWQSADLILLNGAGYATWVRYASLPPERLVDTSASFQDRLIPQRGAGAIHSHGPQGEHSHGSYASTIWLDLALAARQATSVFEALLALSPGDGELFERGHRELQLHLQRLHAEVGDVLAPSRGETVIYSHPVYAYFARAYGLPGISLHWEPQQMPEEAQWAQLERALAGQESALMIWERQPAAAIAQRLQQMGVEVLVWQLGAGNPWREFAAVMAQNVAAAGARAVE